MNINLEKDDIEFIILSLKYGKENYKQKSLKYLYDTTSPNYDRDIRKPTIDKYENLINKLKELI